MAMALVAVALLSCGGRRGGDAVRSVYYWSTTLRMDSVKEQFMREHNVSRMYIRYFDVVEDERPPRAQRHAALCYGCA